jgi:hypothetical protein
VIKGAALQVKEFIFVPFADAALQFVRMHGPDPK